MKPLRILETCLYVTDLNAAAAFYGKVLGLTLHAHEPGRDLFFRCGDSMLLLFLPEATNIPDGDLPAHGTKGSGHAAFAVPHEEIRLWEEHLHAHGVAIEQVVDWPNGARSLFFRDPAGNALEVASAGLWNG